jgi:acetyltransferase-like isoleucine patch superfamily enzyme
MWHYIKVRFKLILKRVLLYIFCKWYRKNNRIVLHKSNGKVTEVFGIRGLTIRFKGRNSVVEVHEAIKFKRKLLCNRSKIKICGDNNYVSIDRTKHYIANLKIIELGNNNKILVGENLFQSGLCRIDFCNQDEMLFEIGKDCMFGQNVQFMLGDWHSIYNSDGICSNVSQKGIRVGDNVWIARNSTIMKDVSIPNGSVVALGSIVTKEFDEPNVIIAGIPAKIVKHDISWSHKNPKKQPDDAR